MKLSILLKDLETIIYDYDGQLNRFSGSNNIRRWMILHQDIVYNAHTRIRARRDYINYATASYNTYGDCRRHKYLFIYKIHNNTLEVKGSSQYSSHPQYPRTKSYILNPTSDQLIRLHEIRDETDERIHEYLDTVFDSINKGCYIVTYRPVLHKPSIEI